MAPRSRADEFLPPSRLKERRRKSRIVKSILWIVLLLTLLGGFILLTYLQGIRIREVNVEGVYSISSETLKESALRELSGKYFWVIPRNSILLYSTEALESALLTEYPKLKSADVSLANFHTITIKVEERIGIALWCGGAGQVEMQPYTCYSIDAAGYVYEEAPTDSATSSVLWFGALSAENIPAQFLDAEQFRSAQLLVEALRTQTRTPTRVLIDGNKDVFVRFAEGFEIRFTLLQKPEEVLALLKAAENSSALSGKKLSDLVYLDLRFGERLYYKFK